MNKPRVLPARTKGDLKIIRADGTIEVVDKAQADRQAKTVCRNIDPLRERNVMYRSNEEKDA